MSELSIVTFVSAVFVTDPYVTDVVITQLPSATAVTVPFLTVATDSSDEL